MPFLRETSLPCTEQQMEALTGCLSRPEAFGPVSTWGPEVFTEIGTLAGTKTKGNKITHRVFNAAEFVGTGRVFICGEVVYVPLCLCPGGLEDLVLSALVREQLEGITPQALALVTPKKMAVSCQCSCLSHLVMSSVTQIWAFYATNRWFSVPGSCRGSPWSRRGRSQRTSGQSWTLSRNSLSSEPDMKATSCWSSEVRAHTLPFSTGVQIQHKFHPELCWSCDHNQPSLCPVPPGRNSAAAVLVAERFSVHLLALCLCLWLAM